MSKKETCVCVGILNSKILIINDTFSLIKNILGFYITFILQKNMGLEKRHKYENLRVHS